MKILPSKSKESKNKFMDSTESGDSVREWPKRRELVGDKDNL